MISSTPDIWIGEVSWLKASLFNDSETYVPSTIQKIYEIFEEEPIITDEIIQKVKDAFSCKNVTGYSLVKEDEVIKFLKLYKGKKAFTVSW